MGHMTHNISSLGVIVFKYFVSFMSAFILSAQAFGQCGKHRDDIKYRSLNWEKAAVL